MQMPGSAHASFTPCRVQKTSFQGSQLHFTSFNTKHFGGASTYFKSSQVLKSGPVWVSFGCCLNKALQLHRQTSLSFRLLKEHQRKTHLDVSALRAHWKVNTETPRSVHVWKMKRRSLEMFQISECEPAFETTSVLALSSPTRAPFSSCRLVPPAQNDSLHSLDSLRQGHALAPLTQDTYYMPWENTTGFRGICSVRARAVTGRQTKWWTYWWTITWRQTGQNLW